MDDLDQLNKTIIIIDWGFTRLKLWSLDSAGNILNETSYYTSKLVNNPAFYDHQDMIKISNIVETYINKQNRDASIEIHSCSQMHGLVGEYEDGKYFFSTWNDIIPTNRSSDWINIIDGVPNLYSMPRNKLSKEGNGYSINSLLCKQSNSRVKKLFSPVSLILSIIYKEDIRCDLGWWQSTCIDHEKQNLLGVTVTDQPQVIKIRSNQEHKKENTKVIQIYPETGDLQASTSRSLDKYDILINTGTGSQVIINNYLCSKKDYYRYWNNIRKSRYVVSHVPCGRLLSDFCKINNIDINMLRKIFHNHINDLGDIDTVKSKKSILYFPGYCSKTQKYTNKPNLELNALKGISESELLECWIMQYVCIIQQSLINNLEVVNIGITGKLGGFAFILSKGLKYYLGDNFKLDLVDIDLPKSLMDYNLRGYWDHKLK